MALDFSPAPTTRQWYSGCDHFKAYTHHTWHYKLSDCLLHFLFSCPDSSVFSLCRMWRQGLSWWCSKEDTQEPLLRAVWSRRRTGREEGVRSRINAQKTNLHLWENSEKNKRFGSITGFGWWPVCINVLPVVMTLLFREHRSIFCKWKGVLILKKKNQNDIYLWNMFFHHSLV